MAENLHKEPEETEGREDYYEAALICIILHCDACSAYLDPDEHLGPGKSFASDGYFVLLGDEAYNQGWVIEGFPGGVFTILCPACGKSAASAKSGPDQLL